MRCEYYTLIYLIIQVSQQQQCYDAVFTFYTNEFSTSMHVVSCEGVCVLFFAWMHKHPLDFKTIIRRNNLNTYKDVLWWHWHYVKV